MTPNYPEAMLPELERCFDQLGFSGIKIHLHSGRAYDDPLYAPMYEFADARGLPILAHTWGIDSIRALGAMATRYQNASFLCGHTGAQDLRVYVEEARRSPNFFLELCLSAGTPWIVERLVSSVGAGRIVWGSDTLLLSSGQQIGKVLFADVSEQDKLEILGLNAASIFHLRDRIR
jgi:predicted TIM-barrel fold metal-dependent hydrolase